MKRKILPLPATSFLHELFIYNPESGKLTWRERPREHFKLTRLWKRWNTHYANREAGSKAVREDGHPLAIMVGIDKKVFLAHRIIVAMLGYIVPDDMLIDHGDCNSWNNKWSNLRVATGTENCANSRLQRFKTLPKGVVMNGSKFIARIQNDGVPKYLGTFNTPEEASAAYALAARNVFGEFARS